MCRDESGAKIADRIGRTPDGGGELQDNNQDRHDGENAPHRDSPIGNPPIESGEGDRAARQSEGTVSWLPHREQRTEPLGFSSKHSEQTRIVLTK
jgi:hypothetical protein